MNWTRSTITEYFLRFTWPQQHVCGRKHRCTSIRWARVCFHSLQKNLLFWFSILMKEICVLRVSKNCLTTLKVYYDYFHYICMFVSDCQWVEGAWESQWCPIPQSWSYKQLWASSCGDWELNSYLLHRQPMCLNHWDIFQLSTTLSASKVVHTIQSRGEY